MIVAPNNANYLGYLARPLVEPYVHFFELAARWNYFAPDPGPPPVFIEWELVDQDSHVFELGRMPKDLINPYFFTDRQTRRVSVVKFMVSDDFYSEHMLVPYLCAKNSPQYGRNDNKIHSVKLSKVMYTLPTLVDVKNKVRKIGDEVGMIRQEIGRTFCSGEKL